jgi:hypothetical protein
MVQRSIRAGDLLRDIRAGTAFPTLLSKYELSFTQFHAIISKLVDEGVLQVAEVVGRYPLIEPESLTGTIIFDGNVRRYPRRLVQFPLPVHLAHTPQVKGRIEDISEMGVRIRGIKSEPYEVHAFVIPVKECLRVDSVIFEAVCRWSQQGYTDTKWVGGHEVLEFLHGSLADLQNWLFNLRQSTNEQQV